MRPKIYENEDSGKEAMNIDDRIEALTQSVELLSQMHQDNEKRYNAWFEQLVSINERLARIIDDYIRGLRNGH